MWFKVDDQFWSHPKIVECSAEALSLWVRAGSYASHHLTNGRITGGVLPMLGATPAVADELVSVGLWCRLDGRTWEFHDWFDYQPAAEAVAERRAKRVAAGRKGAQARWGDKDASATEAPAMASAMANAIADGWQDDAPSPSPSPDSKNSQRQSPPERARAVTDSVQVLEMTQRIAAQRGIASLAMVVDAIHRHTAARVDESGALQVSLWLLEKAKSWPDNPERYVIRCIERTPAEVEKHIFEAVA